MADVQYSGNVESEWQSVCDGLVKEAQDLKAKSPMATLLGDGAPILLSLMSSYAALAVDLKSAEAIAYLGLTLGKIAALFVAKAA